MKNLTILVALILSSLIAKPARADSATNEFARCLVAFDSARMRDWVEWDGPGLIYKEMSAAAALADCGRDVKLEYWNFRGALAEALVKKQFSGAEIPDLAKARPVTDIDMALAWGNNDGRTNMLLNVYSECLVRGSSKRAFGLLVTDHDSDDERRAFKALQADDSECRKLAGDFRPGRANGMLRARVALAFFRTAEETK